MQKYTPELTMGLLRTRELTPWAAWSSSMRYLLFTSAIMSVCAWGALAKALWVTLGVFLASQERQLLNKVNWSFGEFLLHRWSIPPVMTSGEVVRRNTHKWPPEQGTPVEKLSSLRSDFKRSWIPSRSCFLKCLYIGTLCFLNWVCKNTAWMGTLTCGGLHDFLVVTWQFKNRNRNIGFLMSIVSIRTILLRATETKGLAFKIHDLKGKLHFFGKVQMYFIRLCCYSQSLVVNKYDFYAGSHTSGLQCL